MAVRYTVAGPDRSISGRCTLKMLPEDRANIGAALSRVLICCICVTPARKCVSGTCDYTAAIVSGGLTWIFEDSDCVGHCASCPDGSSLTVLYPPADESDTLSVDCVLEVP